MTGVAQYKPASFNLSRVVLIPKYPAPIKLNPEMKDIYDLLDYIPPSHKAYYMELIRVQRNDLATATAVEDMIQMLTTTSKITTLTLKYVTQASRQRRLYAALTQDG